MSDAVNRFFLRGVNVKSINEKYKNGDYANVESPPSRIKIVEEKIEVKDKIGVTADSHKYWSKTSSITRQLIFTTNHASWVLAKNNEIDDNEYPCCWCNRMSRSSLGIPVKCERVGKKIIFYVDLHVCTFACGCAFAELQQLISDSRQCTVYSKSLLLIKSMFNLVYKDEKLVSAPPFYMREILGDEDFFKNDKIYIHTDEIILVPIKTVIITEGRNSY